MILLEDVVKTYSSGSPALNGISLNRDAGEFVFIVGDSGSGKSTLISHLNGLYKADSGDILFNGKSIYAKDYNLTSREAQILKLITEGYSNNEIANELFVSINTTKAHVASILQKLEVDDRLQAALKALKERLV